MVPYISEKSSALFLVFNSVSEKSFGLENYSVDNSDKFSKDQEKDIK